VDNGANAIAMCEGQHVTVIAALSVAPPPQHHRRHHLVVAAGFGAGAPPAVGRRGTRTLVGPPNTTTATASSMSRAPFRVTTVNRYGSWVTHMAWREVDDA